MINRAIKVLVLILVGCSNSVPGSLPPFIQSRLMMKTGHSPGSVEIADLNNDGYPDIAVANMGDSNVSIFLNNGKAGFRESPRSPFACGFMPNDIAFADFNKDGNTDLAFANHEKKYLSILCGNGRGEFTAMKGSPFPVKVRPHTHGIAVADFNGDGILDLATDSWGNDEIAVLFGDSSGFNSPLLYLRTGKHPYQRLRTTDINGDGKADIITTNLDDNNTSILLGDGQGHFHDAPGSPVACGDAPFGVAIADLNNDGKPDLAIVNSPTITSDKTGRDGLTILFGDGTGGFSVMPGSPFKTGKSPSRVAIGDINGDGFKDVVVADYNDKSITVFMMDKKGIASASTIDTGRSPDGLAVHDMNADGKADIIVSNGGDDNLEILLAK